MLTVARYLLENNDNDDKILKVVGDDLPNGGWKSIEGSGDNKCKCGSWKKHWEKFSGVEFPKKCSVDGCNAEAEDGSHMINTYDSDRWWIVPTCHKCNTTYDKEMTLKDNTIIVSANRSITCEKISFEKNPYFNF